MSTFGVTNFRNSVLPAYENSKKWREANVRVKIAGHADSVTLTHDLEIKSQYFQELLRSGAWKANGDPMDGIEIVTRKYEELLTEINQKYADNQEERLKHISALNAVYQNHVKSIAGQPFIMALQREIQSGQYPELDPRKLYGADEKTLQQYADNIKVLDRVKDSFLKFASDLYREIIGGGKTDDGKIPLGDYIDKLSSKETTSLGDMSLNDMLSVLSKITQKGNLLEAYREIVSDESINEAIRGEIAIILG